MDNVNMSRFDMSPLSRQFLQRATDNMSAQMNTVRTEDETAPDDAHAAHEREITDMAFLDASTVTADEGLEAAEYSGELGEFTDDLVEDDSEKAEDLRAHRRHAQTKDLDQLSRTVHADGQTGTTTGEQRDEADRLELQDMMAQLRGDVPDEIWAASTSMIENQMVGQTPKAALMQLKSIPEPGMLEMSSAPYASEPLDITDRQTGPLPAHVN